MYCTNYFSEEDLCGDLNNLIKRFYFYAYPLLGIKYAENVSDSKK